MLKLTIAERELFDQKRNTFYQVKSQTLQLEHSLVSVAKWEAKWEKPFLDEKAKSFEETLDYIRCMTITQNVDPNVYYALSNNDIDAVNKYIARPMTATWFTNLEEEKKGPKKSVTPTAELIYYWMIVFNIPFECQKWHLNRLLTLIRVCEVKQRPDKKMSKAAMHKRNKALNQARKRRLGTRG